jgi:hypothetical protein
MAFDGIFWLLARGVACLEFQKQNKQKKTLNYTDAFEYVTREWFEKKKPIWTEK